MNARIHTTRRGFLGQVLALGAAPFATRLAGAQKRHGSPVRLGHIGTGGRGVANLSNFMATEGSQCIALCDPFESRLLAAEARVRETQSMAPRLYNNYRDLLTQPDIDAVVISTPDHWHVPIALDAIRAGKDVYLEKPLGYSLEQNRLLHAAVSASDRVFQYGTQQRSSEIIKRGVELVLNGYVGELERIDVWCPGGRSGGSTAEIPIPPGLDYDLYLGPAPFRPCTADRITSEGSWYCSDYALGFIAGWGAHALDLLVWASACDQVGPVTFQGTGSFPSSDSLFDTCTSWDLRIEFANGVPMRFMSADVAEPFTRTYRRNVPPDGGTEPGPPDNGTTFFGRKGWVSLSRYGTEASDPTWLRLRQCEGTQRVVYHPHYFQAFVDSVRSRTHLVGPIADAVRSDAISHLSLIAIRSGRKVTWDPHQNKIVKPAELDRERHRPARARYFSPPS